MKKLGNKGSTLMELVITMALFSLAIIMAGGIIVTTTGTYINMTLTSEAEAMTEAIFNFAEERLRNATAVKIVTDSFGGSQIDEGINPNDDYKMCMKIIDGKLNFNEDIDSIGYENGWVSVFANSDYAKYKFKLIVTKSEDGLEGYVNLRVLAYDGEDHYVCAKSACIRVNSIAAGHGEIVDLTVVSDDEEENRTNTYVLLNSESLLEDYVEPEI